MLTVGLKSLKQCIDSKSNTYYTSPSNLETKSTPIHYKIIFQENEAVQTSNNLQIFHKELDDCRETMIERYGWTPKYEQRMFSDHKASVLGFAVTKDNEIAGLISILPFDANKVKELLKQNKKDKPMNLNEYFDELWGSDDESEEIIYEKNCEVAMIVLPKYQRRGIGTKLTQEAWNKFGENKKVRWVAFVQSKKSDNFIKKMQTNKAIIIVNQNNV